MQTFLFAILFSLAFIPNVYADNIYMDKIEQIILSDKTFLENISATEEQVRKVLEDEYFATYIEIEAQNKVNGDVNANWDIIEWHTDKIKHFLNYIFTGDVDVPQNNKNKTHPPNTNWNHAPDWGESPRRHRRNMCECGCNSCLNCYYKNSQFN